MLLLGICDDLECDRLIIETLIKDYCAKEDYDIEIIAFKNGEALVNYYIDNKTSFDIIFLDIYMTGENGIKTAEQIRKYDSECKIIFATSSPDHALDSFGVFPFNYLVKPFSKKIFDSVFEKSIKACDKERLKSLVIKSGSIVQTVFYKDILYIESIARMIYVHTANSKTLSFYSTLDALEKQINDKRFLRCHKSYLVNMDHISSVEDIFLKLIDDAQIPITQRNLTSIKKIFYCYILDKANFKNNIDKAD